MIDPPSPDCLEQGAALHFPGTAALSDIASPSDAYLSNPQASPRANPPPNPPFVFPARPSSSSAPSSLSKSTGRRPRSAIEPRSSAPQGTFDDNQHPVARSPALPAFSFNPGALPPTPGPESMFLSPPQSPSAPNSPRLAATRPGGHGHRRGGSEFVGGSIRDGEAITVLNTSPTKSESGMASPMLQPTRPRRGHAHRRSAAISSHDLSSIIVPPSNSSTRGNSAPSSPAVAERPPNPTFPVPEKPVEKEEVTLLPEPEPVVVPEPSIPPPPVVAQPEQTPKVSARNRVGFSDTLEYIPRPLSLVSTDTSSTVRPGHSVSGSISSVISFSNADRELSPFSGCASPQKLSDSRPSTAGAVMERTQSAQEQDPSLRSPRRRGSIPLLGSLPPGVPLTPATPSPTRSSKKWSFFSLDPFAAGSPTRAQSDSPRSTISHLGLSERRSAERVVDLTPQVLADEPEAPKAAGKKKSKKKKKVKTWAGSILSRKGKHRHGKAKRRAPTPPPPRHFDFDDELDDGAISMSSAPEPQESTSTVDQSSENDDWQTWKFPKSTQNPNEDASYQMIDLDAALGPFNTPLPRNPEWEAAQKAGGLIKKQLHSAAGMSRFSGPGMHYVHRRAESAPELAPFEAGRFGFRRFGSSSSMADVFEEDEEEEDSSVSSTGPSTPAAGTSIAEKPEDVAHPEEVLDNGCERVVQAESVVASTTEATQDGNCEADNASQTAGPASFQSAESVCDEVDLAEPNPPYAGGLPGSASGSATPSPRHVFRPKDLAPVEVTPLSLPSASLGPASPWSLTQSSSAFPSPRSPMSYDAQCISTAPSSVTEDNFQSLLMGEPGPEVRISVDDIPSLTSSNSTMTRESLFAQHPQARHPPLSDQPRPASFTSSAFGRRRSSLASLSRLINSSHGERSKLSIEVPMDSEPEKKAKASKTKRLSRMMQFWKSKDTTA